MSPFDHLQRALTIARRWTDLIRPFMRGRSRDNGRAIGMIYCAMLRFAPDPQEFENGFKEGIEFMDRVGSEVRLQQAMDIMERVKKAGEG